MDGILVGKSNSPAEGIDIVSNLRKKYPSLQEHYQNDCGMISEEMSKEYSSWEVYLYEFSDTDVQIVVCVS